MGDFSIKGYKGREPSVSPSVRTGDGVNEVSHRKVDLDLFLTVELRLSRVVQS